MVDMAIGIIMGTAFNKVVSVLVKQVFMPPLVLMTGETGLEERKFILREATGELSEIAIGYGYLGDALLDFLVIGLTVFVVVKVMNRFQSKADDSENKEVETPKNIELLANIERLMKEQNQLLQKKGS